MSGPSGGIFLTHTVYLTNVGIHCCSHFSILHVMDMLQHCCISSSHSFLCLTTRGLHGNGDDGNTAVTGTTFTVISWGWGAMPTVIPR